MSNSHYEKIGLSAHELRYVYGQIYNRAKERLDIHLPQEGEDNVAFKNLVFEYISDLLVEGFELAKHSVVIDGRDVDDRIVDVLRLQPKEVIAPLDVSINDRLRQVLLNVEQKTIEVTKLRREIPAQVHAVYDDLVASVDSQVSKILEDIENSGEDVEEVDDMIPRFEDIDAMVDDFEHHIFILNELKQSIPKCKAELDRFDETILFLENTHQAVD